MCRWSMSIGDLSDPISLQLQASGLSTERNVQVFVTSSADDNCDDVVQHISYRGQERHSIVLTTR